ncbi:MAG: serine/threonine-protein kinase [Pirellulaceae bacterium]
MARDVALVSMDSITIIQSGTGQSETGQSETGQSGTMRPGTIRPTTAHRNTYSLAEWELLGPIGEGEWSTVFRARPRDCGADRPADYAIKLARAGDPRRPPAEALLAREATIGRGVLHPHLIAILLAHLDTPPYYLVMPLLQGATLRDALVSCGPLSTPHALWIVRQMAEALAALHQAGWIHADVKPSNMYVSPAGHATLIDLGFALRMDSAECAPGASLRGTMLYTAPEMISSAVPVNERSDTYSLGITLYELLTGNPPFVDEAPEQLVLAHLQRAVPNPRRTLPGLNHEVNRLLRDMLAKEPLRRPTDAELIQRMVDLEIATLEERPASCDGGHSGQRADEFIDDQVSDIQRGSRGR